MSHPTFRVGSLTPSTEHPVFLFQLESPTSSFSINTFFKRKSTNYPPPPPRQPNYRGQLIYPLNQLCKSNK